MAPVKRENSPTAPSSTTSSPTKKARKQRQGRRDWTPAEEAIFLEIIEKICGAGLWQEIKNDGRLGHRGQPGIRAHYLALFKNLKKGASGTGSDSAKDIGI